MSTSETGPAIEHVVLVHWADSAEASSRARIAELSRKLPWVIPGIVSVAQGASVSPEGLEGGFEWMLVVRFEDAAARDAYLPHPEHLPLAALIGANAARVVVFDVPATN